MVLKITKMGAGYECDLQSHRIWFYTTTKDGRVLHVECSHSRDSGKEAQKGTLWVDVCTIGNAGEERFEVGGKQELLYTKDGVLEFARQVSGAQYTEIEFVSLETLTKECGEQYAQARAKALHASAEK